MMKLVRRFLLILVSIALILATLVAAFFGVEDWRGAKAWAEAQRDVRAQGGTTDFAEVIPAPIPDDQNLAMAPLFARALDYHVDPITKQLTFGTRKNPRLDGLPYGEESSGRMRPTSGGGWERGHPLDLPGWQKFYRADPAFPRVPESPSPAADVLLALSRYATPLDELAQAAAVRPRSRFPIDWTQPDVYGISLRHGDLLQRLSVALRLRACAELDKGSHAAAAADIALAFQLCDALAADPMVVDHLVDITILGLTIQPIWEGLAAHRWDAGELARFQTALCKEDVLVDYARAMRTEVASTGRGIDWLEEHRDLKILLQIFSMATGAVDTETSYGGLPAWLAIAPRGWYDQNKAREVRYLQTYPLGAVDPSAHRVFPEKLAAGIDARGKVRLEPVMNLRLMF